MARRDIARRARLDDRERAGPCLSIPLELLDTIWMEPPSTTSSRQRVARRALPVLAALTRRSAEAAAEHGLQGVGGHDGQGQRRARSCWRHHGELREPRRLCDERAG